MVFAFATKDTKTMLPMIFGLTSTLTMCIMLDGVRPMPDHLFLQSVSGIKFLCSRVNSGIFLLMICDQLNLTALEILIVLVVVQS